jgi:hypothetical protein
VPALEGAAVDAPIAPSVPTVETAPIPASVPSGVVTPEERSERLGRVISSKSLEGYFVIDRNEHSATAVLSRPGQQVNHVLHALITIFTCGLWVIPWLIMGLTKRKEERLRISIDQYGNLSEERMQLS